MNLDSIKQLVQDVKDGNENPLLAYGQIKQQIDEATICLKKIKEDAILAALNYEGKTFTSNNFKFTLGEGRANYNYKGIPNWVAANKKRLEVEAQAKAAFAAYSKKLNVADEDGEIVELPIVTYSEPSLSAKYVGD